MDGLAAADAHVTLYLSVDNDGKSIHVPLQAGGGVMGALGLCFACCGGRALCLNSETYERLLCGMPATCTLQAAFTHGPACLSTDFAWDVGALM